MDKSLEQLFNRKPFGAIEQPKGPTEVEAAKTVAEAKLKEYQEEKVPAHLQDILGDRFGVGIKIDKAESAPMMGRSVLGYEPKQGAGNVANKNSAA